ncbi:MAG: response regulator [Desulfomonile tiedjei]|uniref:Response regulator n=1 Tax=Desulfomonile tiedjei TaxID=2358 RepID=A0A9D6V3A3_9BACT|nr:response regulator [Desulfomonile tiedjei]
MTEGRRTALTTLLIVDDEEPFLQVMKRRLSKRRFRVITAQSGQQALRALSEHPEVDVVVLDIKMAGMDGIQTLKEIKKRCPAVEVVLLSGHASFESALEGMRSGAFDHLMKPCDLEELSAKIEEARARKLRLAERLAEADRRAS